ncbi:MAG: tol-pal system YbgF family protein [Chitinophagales bacterium]
MKFSPLLLLFGFAACTSSHDNLKKETDDLLRKANQSFFQSKPQNSLVDSAYTSVENFVKKFPDDTLAPDYLFEEALLQEKQKKYSQVIITLDRIYSTYPQSKQASKSLFLEGFLYANVLNELDKAKEKYQIYLDKYSSVDPKMTNDVQMELQNLGKSPDEILKEIQEKAASDSVKAPS